MRHELPWDAEKPIAPIPEEKLALETSKPKKRIELQNDPMFNFGLAMRIQVGCPLSKSFENFPEFRVLQM